MFTSKKNYDKLENENQKLLNDLNELKTINTYLKQKLNALSCEISLEDNTIKNAEFNPCKEETWDKIDPQSFLVINGEKIYKDFPNQIKWQDFFDASNSLIRYKQSKSKEELLTEDKEKIRFNLLKNLVNHSSSLGEVNNLSKQINSQKEIELQLNYPWARNTNFNPYKPDTWKNAMEGKIVFVDDVPIFNNHDETHVSGNCYMEKEYIFETDWEKLVRLFNFNNDTVEDLAVRKCKLYLLLCNYKDSVVLFTIDNFSFTKAKLDMIRQWDYASLKKVAEEMNYCVNKKMKKNKMMQHLFDTRTPVDNYFFSTLYFVELYKNHELPDLMRDYYHEICMESDNPNEILDKSLYLADKPELKNEILESTKL